MRLLKVALSCAFLVTGSLALECYEWYTNQSPNRLGKVQCNKGEYCFIQSVERPAYCMANCQKPEYQVKKGIHCNQNKDEETSWCHCDTDLCNGDENIFDRNVEVNGSLGNARNCMKYLHVAYSEMLTMRKATINVPRNSAPTHTSIVTTAPPSPVPSPSSTLHQNSPEDKAAALGTSPPTAKLTVKTSNGKVISNPRSNPNRNQPNNKVAAPKPSRFTPVFSVKTPTPTRSPSLSSNPNLKQPKNEGAAPGTSPSTTTAYPSPSPSPSPNLTKKRASAPASSQQPLNINLMLILLVFTSIVY